jgi:predicted short-subunit dehydrogenase-like oxidoreductase (DUF2520 family)
MNVSFIGSGNVAWHLAPALDNIGYVVKEIYSPNARHAEALTERLYQAEVRVSLDFSDSSSSVFIIAVSDDVIQEVAQEIVLPDDAYLIHTSGSQPLSILQYAATANTGVFYPLQTFTKSKKVDFKETPLFLEASNEQTEKAMMTLARAISNHVRITTSEERKALHVAAVFASNFTNHMLTLAQRVMASNNLDFDLLKPLIIETITKSLALGPVPSQTGPARRGDLEILDKHMHFLQQDQDLSEIYKLISQSIIDQHQPE